MDSGTGNSTLTEDQRKEIFLALVQKQDQDMTVTQSRTAVSKEFGVDEEQIRQIEREGLDSQWPPLDES